MMYVQYMYICIYYRNVSNIKYGAMIQYVHLVLDKTTLEKMILRTYRSAPMHIVYIYYIVRILIAIQIHM